MSYYYSSRQRSARNLALFVLFLVGIGLMVGLYYVKTRAQSARHEVEWLSNSVAEEVAAINVLEAEIAHLESPDRLARLAKKELGLVPVSVEQVIWPEEIPDFIPFRPSQNSESDGSTQIPIQSAVPSERERP